MWKKFLTGLVPLLVLGSIMGSGYALFYFVTSQELSLESGDGLNIHVESYSAIGQIEVSPTDPILIYMDQNQITFSQDFESYKITYTFPGDPSLGDVYEESLQFRNLLQFRFVLTIPNPLDDFLTLSGDTDKQTTDSGTSFTFITKLSAFNIGDIKEDQAGLYYLEYSFLPTFNYVEPLLTLDSFNQLMEAANNANISIVFYVEYIETN